ncbi:hypothetical protein KIL84_012232 [Mauremys mutica]|uniref:Uncharacterized protein n=1 Tax=Mauremys mutica TaxID=74926 RepID=A0A9D4B347_9SAUR|nr:hypothetical protein KIL84_012232 [Mauremys mutica]
MCICSLVCNIDHSMWDHPRHQRLLLQPERDPSLTFEMSVPPKPGLAAEDGNTPSQPWKSKRRVSPKCCGFGTCRPTSPPPVSAPLQPRLNSVWWRRGPKGGLMGEIQTIVPGRIS